MSDDPTPYGRCNDCGRELEKDDSFTHCRPCVERIDADHRERERLSGGRDTPTPDAEIAAWVERHDLRISNPTDARAAFEDAATLWMERRSVRARPAEAGTSPAETCETIMREWLAKAGDATSDEAAAAAAAAASVSYGAKLCAEALRAGTSPAPSYDPNVSEALSHSSCDCRTCIQVRRTYPDRPGAGDAAPPTPTRNPQ